MNKFIYGMLMFDMMITEAIEVSDGVYVIDLPHDFQVKVNFGEFIKQTFEQKSKVYMDMYEKNLISLDFALHEIFEDEMSEDELTRLIIQTKQQNGLQLTVDQENYLTEQSK